MELSTCDAPLYAILKFLVQNSEQYILYYGPNFNRASKYYLNLYKHI